MIIQIHAVDSVRTKRLVKEAATVTISVYADRDSPEKIARTMIKVTCSVERIVVLMVELALKNLAMRQVVNVFMATEVNSVQKMIQWSCSVTVTLA